MRVTTTTACSYLQAGQPVALPTETVYGLAAPLHEEAAIKAVFSLKGRPSNNPLIIHVASWQDVLPYCVGSLPTTAQMLAEAFWPGPLTLVLPVDPSLVPSSVRAGLPTAAFRMPCHPRTLEIIEAVGPLVMPSANLSGRPSATMPAHVEEDFGIAFPVVDGGICQAGIESTVLACVAQHWEILRLGALNASDFSTLLGYLPSYDTTAYDAARPLCPGRLYRHYAPQARLLLTGQPYSAMAVVGFQNRHYPAGCTLFAMGTSDNPAATAAGLYAALRAVDAAGFEEAWVDMLFPTEGLWQTIAERLQRASAR